jgi:hypothetical protein
VEKKNNVHPMCVYFGGFIDELSFNERVLETSIESQEKQYKVELY